jgi:hypothetical protein
MMSSLLGPDGFPVGQVGRSQRPDRPDGEKKGIDPVAMERLYEMVQQRMRSDEGHAVIEKRVSIHTRKVDSAISFWKPIYFNHSREGRLLNGIEAYELGDEKRTPGSACDKAPYIAMCNLMALEAIKMMGDQMPTAEKGILLAYASEREKEISQFWKEMFAPTEFQAEWAWKGVLAVLAGNPAAAHELLENYRSQLP